jgi:streptomycin 6-kinase
LVPEAEFVLDDAARGRLLSRFGEGVREWCAGLPRLVEQYCSRWDLRLEQAQSGSTSRVYFGWQRGRPGQPAQPGQPEREVVLKVTPEPSIAREEAAALRAWTATPHAVALLDADPDGGALLLERVRPGTKLWDAGALPPAAEMAQLLTGLRVATGDLTGQLTPLSERIEFIFELIRGRLAGPRVAPLVDPDLVTAGHELARALVRTGPTALVHGDLHLANILIARQPRQPRQPKPDQPRQLRRLVAIDPRPGLGDPDFDAVDWVLAPGASQTPEQQVRQRIEELGGLVPGLDGDRLWAWCQASAIIIVVQHLHNRPADSRIPFLLQLAAR